MNKTISPILGFTLAGVLAFVVTSVHADTFGSGANAFTIDFVNIGNAGNEDDAGAGGGIYSGPYGGVSYLYRMGVYEISQDQIDKATASELTNVTAGAWPGSQPAAFVEWYEAAAFVNWLNTSKGYQAAYDLSFSGNWSMTLWSSEDAWQMDGENLYRHKDACYFLPSEDEWYKAAYHQNDGMTANYWDYATGSNSIPDGIDFNGDTTFDAVFFQGYDQNQPHGVSNVGLASPYGTYGQNGNVFEWNESAVSSPNSIPTEDRAVRGGSWADMDSDLRSVAVAVNDPSQSSFAALGFRVASVPEPSSALLLLGSGIMLLPRRRCASAR